MTSDADETALAKIYRDPRNVERRAEGVRYEAALQDGTLVEVVAIARDIAAVIRSPERFLEAIERASRHHEGASRPLSWGRTDDGLMHVAFARTTPLPASHGSITPSTL